MSAARDGVPTPVLGVILAGGLARRMGGGDKPLLPLAGRPILAHVIARLAPQVAAVAISASGDPARFAEAAPGLPVLPDPMPGNPGPLAGILAGLDHAAAQGLLWVLTVPGDTPFIPDNLGARLDAARRAAGAPIACAASAGRLHPPIGFWSVSLRHDLREMLAIGERRVAVWAGRHGNAVAAWPATPLDPFLNLNTPDELAAAARICHANLAAPASIGEATPRQDAGALSPRTGPITN